MEDRCSGHCCRSFPLPYGPGELYDRQKTILDGEFIVDMVVYQKPGPDHFHFYTCKYHDAETGNCRAYEKRPAMCRDYPYGRPCEHKECTWTAAEEATTPIWKRQLKVLQDERMTQQSETL